MQTAIYRRFGWIVLPFPELTANRYQRNWSIIQANLGDIQTNRSDNQVDRNMVFHFRSISLYFAAYAAVQLALDKETTRYKLQ